MRSWQSFQGLACLRWLLLLALCLLALVHAPARPAEAAPGSSAAAPASAAGPIFLQDILIRADEQEQRLEWASRLLAAPDPAQRLARTLADIAGPVDAKLRAASELPLQALPIMRLESLARHWEFDARRFRHWEVQASRALTPYRDSALELAQARAVWAATRAAGTLDGLPPILADRVQATLGQIDATQAALDAILARHMELTRKASDLKTRIQVGSNGVAAAIDDIDHRLLQIDAPPLWTGLGPTQGAQAAFAAMDRGLDIEKQFAVDYHAAGTGNQQALRVIQILLLPLIFWLFVRSRRIQPDSAPAISTRVLRRPLSAWVLLSMLSVLLLEPDAPLLVQEFALLIALIPVLRLIPTGTLRALGVWPYIAIALYGLDRLGVAVVADLALYRLFLLVLNVLALGLTVWMLYRPASQAKSLRDRRMQRAMRPVGWVALLILSVAALCNIVGNVSMAEALTSGVIDSGYMALLLYTGVTACLAIGNTLVNQPEFANLAFMRRHGAIIHTAFARVLTLCALVGWLLYSIDRFRLLRPLHEATTSVLAFGIEVGEVSFDLGDVLVFLFSAWLAFWVARAVRRLLHDELPGVARLPRGAGHSIASLSYYGVLIIGLLVALSAAGFKVGQLALVFGALGVGIGFGLQNVVNNLVSGLVLMFERPIQPGDFVEAAGSLGTVREIGLRATTLRSPDGADVVVPNGLLLSGNLLNWTMYDRSRRIDISIGVAFGSDPAQVLAVLTMAAREAPGVAREPAPVVFMTDYTDNALLFVIRVWTQDIATLPNVRSDVLAGAMTALQAAGVSVPHRQVDLHLRTVPDTVRTWAQPQPEGPRQV